MSVFSLGFALGVVSLAWAGPAAQPANPPSALPKGPWLQRPTPTQMTIMWETRLPVQTALRYAPLDGSGPEQQVLTTPTVIDHRVTLTGLKPGSAYRYRVQDTMGRWHAGRFRTARQAASG